MDTYIIWAIFYTNLLALIDGTIYYVWINYWPLIKLYWSILYNIYSLI